MHCTLLYTFWQMLCKIWVLQFIHIVEKVRTAWQYGIPNNAMLHKWIHKECVRNLLVGSLALDVIANKNQKTSWKWGVHHRHTQIHTFKVIEIQYNLPHRDSVMNIFWNATQSKIFPKIILWNIRCFLFFHDKIAIVMKSVNTVPLKTQIKLITPFWSGSVWLKNGKRNCILKTCILKPA